MRFLKPAAAAIAVLAGFGHPASAQFTPAVNLASMVVSSSGLSCKTSAGTGVFQASNWSWGESTPVTFGSSAGGVSAGKVSFSTFEIQKNSDGCTSALAGLVETGGHVTQITAQEFDKNKTLLTTIVFTNAVFTNYSAGGTVTNAVPVENVGFIFEAVKITNAITHQTESWDVVTNKGS